MIFKGVNELTLNQATMIEALQLWVNSQMVGTKPCVTSIRSTGRGDNQFFVVIAEPKAVEPA